MAVNIKKEGGTMPKKKLEQKAKHAPKCECPNCKGIYFLITKKGNNLQCRRCTWQFKNADLTEARFYMEDTGKYSKWSKVMTAND